MDCDSIPIIPEIINNEKSVTEILEISVNNEEDEDFEEFINRHSSY